MFYVCREFFSVPSAGKHIATLRLDDIGVVRGLDNLLVLQKRVGGMFEDEEGRVLFWVHGTADIFPAPQKVY